MSINLAKEMGTFEEWNWRRPQYTYMITELARAGRADDEGALGDPATAYALDIAAARSGDHGQSDAIATILNRVSCIARVLANDCADVRQRAALNQIELATTDWK